MTASLDTACREIDQLLVRCLIAWAEAIEGDVTGDRLILVHTHYMQTCTYLYDAREALEAAIRSLETVAAWPGGKRSGELPQPAAAKSAPVFINFNCGSNPVVTPLPDQPDTSGSSSRPDRPTRPKAPWRGNIRDWNRTVSTIPPHQQCSSHGDGCLCDQDRVADSAASGLGHPSPYGGHHGHADEGEVQAGSTPAGASRAELHQSDRSGSKEPTDGEKNKSTRSRRRG